MSGSVVLLSVCCLCLTPDLFTTFVQSMKTLFGSFVIQCIYAGEFGKPFKVILLFVSTFGVRFIPMSW